MLWIILGLITSYLIGSIPTAYLWGRLLKGIDIRSFGSGNVGATNAWRVLGKGPGLAVLSLDIIKGLATVVFLGDLLAGRVSLFTDETLRVLLGLGCVSGHNWTIFLGFKGGKGIATSLGILLGLASKIEGLGSALVPVALTWLVAFLVFRIVSIASVCSALALPACLLFSRQSKTLLASGIILATFVLYKHRSNLRRFFKGQEPRLF